MKIKVFEKIKNAKIKHKMARLINVSNILTGLLIIILLINLNMTCTNFKNAYTDYGVASGNAMSVLAEFEKCVSAVERGALAEDSDDLESAVAVAQESLTGLTEQLDSLEEMLVDTSAQKLFKTMRTTLDTISEAAVTALTYEAAGEQEQAAAVILADDTQALMTEAESEIADLYNELIALGTAENTATVMNQNVLVVIAIVAMVLTLCFVAQIGTAVSKSLRLPAANMTAAANKMAVGDVDVDIQHFYDDEIGDLSDSLKEMADRIREQAEIAKQVSEGNMTVEIQPKGESDLLGNSLEHMVSEENRVMSGIRSAVMEIRTGSEEVAAASQSLAQGSTEQASAIQQITASLNDITERTKVNASEATNANTLVSHAKDDASEGNEKMHEMITAMADINESSENISKIIKVIDDIAFQTNILALNAAVEAARAGQHGRGFAVVADEVRNLAGKSQQAASETAELIEDSIAKVNRGSKLAEETAKALEAIVEAIDEIVAITNSIAVASNDQANAIAQIDQAISQVSQVVQTNSATSEECAAASEELSAQAGKLREMIRRYRLKDMQPVQSAYAPEEKTGVPEDEEDDRPFNDVPPVISLDDGYGKY